MLSYQYNRLPIQTAAEVEAYEAHECANCAAGGKPSRVAYVYVGRNNNPERLGGYIGPTWQLRCRVCDYAISPDVPMTTERGVEQ